MNARFFPLFVVILLSLTCRAIAFCPLCSAPGLSLSEQFAQSDVAVIGEWSSSKEASETFNGETVFVVVDVLKSGKTPLKAGDRITYPKPRIGKSGLRFLVLGNQATQIEWLDAMELSATGVDYVRRMPALEQPWPKRLEFFVKFLEHSDQMLATDAYTEFARAPYDAVAGLKPLLPRDSIRAWVSSPKTPDMRRGLYGLLIGLCGDDSDARRAEEIIRGHKSKDGRLGIDGIIAGYLLLTGPRGLTLIEEVSLKPDDVPQGETTSAVGALRFLWTYAPEAVSKDRLRATMRVLLTRPDFVATAVTDLARWKDWSIQDQVAALYATEGDLSDRLTREAIIGFLIVCSRDVGSAPNPVAIPEHVRKAKAHLETLRRTDPQMVAKVLRNFDRNSELQ